MQSELEKADSLRDNMSSLMLPNGRPKCLYRAISGRPYLHFARKMADRYNAHCCFWASEGGERDEKVPDFVFTRHRQGLRFHLAPFRNRFWIAQVEVTVSQTISSRYRVNATVFLLFFLMPFSSRTRVGLARRLVSRIPFLGHKRKFESN